MSDDPTKADPLGLNGPGGWRRAQQAQQAQQAQARAEQQKVLFEAAQAQRRAFMYGPMQPGYSPRPYDPSPPPSPLGQGPPEPLALETAGRQIGENARRMDRISDARAIGRPSLPEDVAREAARLGLGKALSEAILSGLLDERRAVAMIVAAGINNRPLQPEEARDYLVAAVAQAVEAGALTRAGAERMLADAARPLAAQGRARPAAIVEEDADDAQRGVLRELALVALDTADPADAELLAEAVPELLGAIDGLEGALYEALTLRPCHLSEHAERHRASPRPCEAQADAALVALLDALDVPRAALPRVPHREADGRSSPCCEADGDLATWLVYGQTTDPQIAPS